MRSLSIGLFAIAMSSVLQPAHAAYCQGWWWQKIDCLEKRVASLEQSQAALQREVRDLPQKFAAQLGALEAKINRRIDAEIKDINGRIAETLRAGVKLRNGKEDTCIFSDNIGVGGFTKCGSDEREVWMLQRP